MTRADAATHLSHQSAKKSATAKDRTDHDEAKSPTCEVQGAANASDDSAIDMNEDNGKKANVSDRVHIDEDTDMQDAVGELTKNLDKSLRLNDDAEHDPDKAQSCHGDEDDELPTVKDFYKLRERLHGLKTTVAGKNQEVQELQDLLIEKENEIKQQDDRIEAITAEIIDVRLKSKHRIDDAHLTGRWRELHYKIKQFVADRFGKSRLGTGSSRIIPGKLFDSITEHPSSYWMTPDDKKLLITGWIWSQLTEHVFGHKGQFWAWDAHRWMGIMRYTVGSMCAVTQTARPRLRIDPITEWIEESNMTNKDYFEWEATTASIFYGVNGIDTTRARRLAHQLDQTLRPYETKRSSSEHCPKLQDIVEEAAQIDAELCQCRAKYVVWMYHPSETTWFAEPSRHRWGFVPKPATMENALGGGCAAGDEDTSYRVDLVISPCLVKYGDSDGEKYESGRVISKSQVVLSGRDGRKLRGSLC